MIGFRLAWRRWSACRLTERLFWSRMRRRPGTSMAGGGGVIRSTAGAWVGAGVTGGGRRWYPMVTLAARPRLIPPGNRADIAAAPGSAASRHLLAAIIKS